MEKRKIVIHTLLSDEQELQKNSKTETANNSVQNLNNKNSVDRNSLIRVKQSDYSVLYFSLISFAFVMIIGLLGYFLYLDYKENNTKINLGVVVEMIKTEDAKIIWPESIGFEKAIKKENYIVMRSTNFDQSFSFILNNKNKVSDFIEKQFNISIIGTETEIEFENSILTTFGNATSSPVYGFYKNDLFIVAKNLDGFSEAIKNKDINKL